MSAKHIVILQPQGVSRIDLSNDFPRFAMGADAEPITMQRTLELEDEW